MALACAVEYRPQRRPSNENGEFGNIRVREGPSPRRSESGKTQSGKGRPHFLCLFVFENTFSYLESACSDRALCQVAKTRYRNAFHFQRAYLADYNQGKLFENAS